jgi:hypothetical protein
MGGEMTRDEFAQLLSDFTHSAESGDGARFAATPDTLRSSGIAWLRHK